MRSDHQTKLGWSFSEPFAAPAVSLPSAEKAFTARNQSSPDHVWKNQTTRQPARRRQRMRGEHGRSGSPAINNDAGTIVVVLRNHVLPGQPTIRSKPVHRIHVIADIHRIG